MSLRKDILGYLGYSGVILGYLGYSEVLCNLSSLIIVQFSQFKILQNQHSEQNSFKLSKHMWVGRKKVGSVGLLETKVIFFLTLCDYPRCSR